MKKIVAAGLLGCLVMIAWLFVANGLLRFSASVNMKKLENEREVYEVLKANVDSPGRYVVNPEADPESGYPADEPVYGLFYSGIGHGSAGRQMLISLPVMILVPILGAWLLAQASDRVLSSYPRKVFFFFVIGLLFVLLGDFNQYGIDGYPLGDMLLVGLNHLAMWTAAGLVIAWRIRPAGKYSMA
jgi:hypothetical protein